MIYLNFSNVEELLFMNQEAQNVLPVHHFSIFEQWRLAKRVPFLREIGRQAVFDLLNALNDDDVALLEQYFDEKIVVEKLNYSVAMNYKIPLTESEVCEVLCDVVGFNYFSTWRDDEYLYISLWR